MTDVTARLFTVNCSSHACTKEADGVDGYCSTCRANRELVKQHESVSERDWQRDIIRLARTLGWRVSHFRPAQTTKGWRTPVAGDGKGLPDLMLCRDRLIFAELKTAKGQLTEKQAEWIAALEVAGIEAYVWRPQDLDHIMQVLQRREHREAAA